MLRNIIISEEYAEKMALVIRGNSSAMAKMTDAEAQDYADKKAEEHKTHVDFFRDINGDAYVVLHGTVPFNSEISGKMFALLQYHDDLEYPDIVYKKLSALNLLKPNETLNIICCYGSVVKETYEEKVRGKWCDKVPVVFVNDTNTGCYSTLCRLMNGTVRYTIGTKRNLLEKIAYKIAASI